MNDFKTCDICKGFNSDTLVEKLKKLDETANISIGCQNFCAVGSKKTFVIVNGIPVNGDNEDELVEKISNIMNK